MKTRIAVLAAVVLMAPSILAATDLDQQTLNAWDQYIQATNSKISQSLTGSSSFLWIDGAPVRRERVHQGEVLVEPAHKDGPQKIPHGLIHDWIGSVFIPNTTINRVYAVLNDYAEYNRFYNPAVVAAKLLDRTEKQQRFSLELEERVAFVTAAIESEYVSQTVRVDEHHWYTVISSTRIQQIEDYGRAKQHTLPPDKGSGYVWRLYAILRFEERDGGVYAECEAIVLSRDIPFEFEWLIKPILQHLPRNAMEAILHKTQDAVAGPDAPPHNSIEAGLDLNEDDHSKGKAPANSLPEPGDPQPVAGASVR
jgi:hypothetical protein